MKLGVIENVSIAAYIRTIKPTTTITAVAFAAAVDVIVAAVVSCGAFIYSSI